jgi:CRISPR/Cas system-associated exonuclease Cas4 (RecB family)
MSQYYNPKRTRNIYDPADSTPFKLSRSKIDLFHDCPRCFFLDRRLGVGRPPGYPFNLNSAVDTLLKKEFDVHRAAKTAHPLMEEYKIDAVPFQHEKMNEWRENFVGVQHHHKSSNFIITGAVDDVWVNPNKELIVVDYKSTAKDGEVNIDAPWQISYKRQMEVYQWLLRQNGFEVSNTGYFVYANGRTDMKAFDAKLEFDVTVLPYTGNANWIEQTLSDIKTTLAQQELPQPGSECDYCPYRAAVHEFEIGGDVA